MSYYWPIALLVLSNVLYHICAKSVPESLHPMAMMVGTYVVGALVSLALFFVMSTDKNFLGQVYHMNWTTVMLGLSIVGLEIGAIYMYKVGWDVSVGNLVMSAILAVALIIVGVLLYKESVSATQLAGIGLCMAGVFLINR